MPFATGLLFLPALAASVWFLEQIPPPSPEEERQRVRRQPMPAAARRALLAEHWMAVGLWTALYMALTAYRDFRDLFAREIWDALGYPDSPAIFSAPDIE